MHDRHITLLEFAAHHLGTAPKELSGRIQRHLASRCPVCQGAQEFVAHLTRVMRRDCQATPPESLVERARALFRFVPNAPAPEPSRYESLAKLIFDSYQEPAPAGVRGRFSPHRHMVFDDRGLVVDLRLEAEAGSNRQAITGQLQSLSIEARQLEGVPLMLVAEGRVIECARTSALGEFHFRNIPCREMSLFVVCRDRMVRVPDIPPATDLG
jgi:hypothetical protein